MATWWVSKEQLDEDQRSVVTLPAEGRFLVTGPPGSGKTNLLLLRANFLYRKKIVNFSLLSFTRALTDFMVIGGKNYNVFPEDRVDTSIGWAMRHINALGGDLSDLPDDFDKRRWTLTDRLSRIVEERNYGYLHDTILLDEAQDYTEAEILLFERIAPNLFFVGDDRQQLYRKDSGLAAATHIILPSDQLNLRFHYRNAPEICGVADRFVKADRGHKPIKPTCNYKGPPGHVKIRQLALSEQFAEIVRRLRVQLDSYPEEYLGVLCVKREILDAFWEYLQCTDLADLSTNLCLSDRVWLGRPILCSTVHTAKGLEFRAVHLPGFEQYKAKNQRNVAYTAVTRAKTALDIYHEREFVGWLGEALLNDEDVPDEPSWDDIFGESD